MFLGHDISAPISQRWVSAFSIKRFRKSNIGFDFQFVTKGESDLRLEWVANGDLSSGEKERVWCFNSIQTLKIRVWNVA
jgi:hypothetical protein